MSTGGTSLARALHSEAEAHQLSLLGVDASPEDIDALRDENGRLPSDAFRRLRAGGRRGPGRPLGSVNKRSEQLAKLVIQEFGDPVLGGASLYAMPLDQLCEMLTVADGTVERAEQLHELTAQVSAQVAELTKGVLLAARNGTATLAELETAAERIADAAESLEAVAKRAGKPGALALQALNVQLMARRFVAEYVHAKRPTAVDVNVKNDGLLIMPRAGTGGAEAEFARTAINAALKSGKLDPSQVARLEFRDGRVIDPEGEIVDADFEPVAAEDGEE